MATPDSIGARALSREVAETLAARVSADEPQSLAAVWLKVEGPADIGEKLAYAIGFVVMVREGGFMVILPDKDSVRAALTGPHLHLSAQVEPAFHTGTVGLVSGRAKDLGLAEVLLVDLPWEGVVLFTEAMSMRSGLGRQVHIIPFQAAGRTGKSGIGRPVAGSALDLALTWIEGDLDAGTAEEYTTGVEFPDAVEPVADSHPVYRDQRAEDPVGGLQRQVADLQQQLASAQSMTASGFEVPRQATATVPDAGDLFAGQQTALAAQDWDKLRKLAGPAPGRARGELVRAAVPPTSSAMVQDGLLAEIEKEVLPEESQMFEAPGLDSVTDPVQRLLLMQIQQNQLLMQKMLQPKDAMANLLTGGSGSDGASTSTGARGCMAREMFLRAMQDLPRIAEQTRDNALKELGIPLSMEDGYLLRRYLEKRVPLQDQKMLGLFGTLISEGWAIAHQPGNLEMKGFLSRAMFFVEQCALDSGKTDLAWLLCGFTEPNSHTFFPVKRTPGLKPFSRLANPLWLSANLAYLRDLDYLQSRASALGKPAPKGADPDAGAKDPKPKNKPKKPKKGDSSDKKDETGA